ncbi:TPA: hypothetical protein RQK84_000883 [Vibrio vulnificus]|nr:hypothetical protein [Vibrio vulnificus]HDY8012853.1 hypothetical protein [Vibrio vulnificus]
MFNLVEKLKNKPVDNSIKQDESSVVCFYKTDSCKSLIEEVCVFENLGTPITLNNSQLEIESFCAKDNYDVKAIVLEYELGTDIIREVENVISLFPNKVPVIVIGSEDSISTLRRLKEMVVYYVFWPITKLELAEFLGHVIKNNQQGKGLGKARSAKKIAVVGSKGGVGTTLITSSLACILVKAHHVSTLVVDHDFYHTAFDLNFGLENFEKKSLLKSDIAKFEDNLSITNLQTKVSSKLSLLSVKSNELKESDILEHLRMSIDSIGDSLNFVLEDISYASQQRKIVFDDPAYFDAFVLVAEPSVISIRETLRAIDHLNDKGFTGKVFVIVCYRCQEKFASLNQREIENALQSNQYVTLDFIPKIEQIIINKRLPESLPGALNRPLGELVKNLIGKQNGNFKNPLYHRILKRQ